MNTHHDMLDKHATSVLPAVNEGLGVRADSASVWAEYGDIEVSVVMPCLNEVSTLRICIEKAWACLNANGIRGEVVVADNGSTDGSAIVAKQVGARVVHAKEKGYGNALRAGFEAASGKYLIMGDADDSYDFTNLMPFIDALRRGSDVVVGARFKGGIAPGAMPWHHKYIGNPLLTATMNLFFRTGISDAHCGLRALTRDAYERMELRTTGMEFASEMLVKASAGGMKMTEVPTTLSPDGRSRPPHLRSFRDGWRHLRFLMTLAPKWVLMYPGSVMLFVGIVLMTLLGGGPVTLGSIVLDHHTMIAAAMLVVVGYQALTIGFLARVFAVREEIGPPSKWLAAGNRLLTLEGGLIGGTILFLMGFLLVGGMTLHWIAKDFGPLNLTSTFRPMLIGTTLIALGSQTLFMSFFYNMLQLTDKEDQSVPTRQRSDSRSERRHECRSDGRAPRE